MEVVALVSGGKDSCMSMLECVRAGHRIVALANLLPPPTAPDELDSFMFQTVGHTVLQSYAQCMGLPLFRHTIRGRALNQDLHYAETREDEVESLYTLLKEVKKRFPNVRGVASGAILSDYQRFRVENVCERLGLVSLAYLWQRDQKELLQEMTQVPIDAVLIKVAAMGLDPYKHLGKSITALRPLLFRLSDEYGCHPCGEGGEYETLTLDCPLFRYRIVLDETEVVIHSDDQFAQVGYLQIARHHLEPKADCSAGSDDQGVVYDIWKDLSFEDHKQAADDEGLDASQATLVGDLGAEGRLDISLSRGAHGHFFARGSVAPCHHQGTEADTVELQLDHIFSTIRVRLAEEASLTMEDVAFVCVYLRDMSLFVRCNDVYRRHFGVNPPSRLCVQMPLDDGVRILVECFGQQRQPQADAERRCRRVLHVQSISRWAPACIGPYSQATMLNGLVHLAGQIALDPATMKLVGSDDAVPIHDRIKEQTLLCLLNIEQVLQAMQSSVGRIVVGTCFVLDMAHRDLILDLWRRWFLRHRAAQGRTKATARSRPSSGLGPDSESEQEDDQEEEEENDQDDGQAPIEPLMRFIAVGALPRGAAVEIQVIASTAEAGSLQRLPAAASASSDDETITVEGVWSPTAGFCFAQVKGIAGETSLVAAADAIRRAVQAADAQLWDRRLFFRLYHLASSSDCCSTAELSRLGAAVQPATASAVPSAGLETEDQSFLLECVIPASPSRSAHEEEEEHGRG